MVLRKGMIPKIRYFSADQLLSFVIRHEAKTRIGRVRQRLFRAILINRLTSRGGYLMIPPVQHMAQAFRCPELIIYNALLELKQDGHRIFLMDRNRPVLLYDAPFRPIEPVQSEVCIV